MLKLKVDFMIGTLLDIFVISEKENSKIKLIFKDEKENIFELIDNSFRPYFFLISNVKKDKIKFTKTNKVFNYKLESVKYDNLFQLKRFANIKKLNEFNKKHYIYKIIFDKISDLIEIRQHIKNEKFFIGKYEYDIPYTLRYLLDNKIKPLYKYEIIKNTNKFEFKEIKQDFDYNLLAFDIETSSIEGYNVKKDPILLISVYNQNTSIVITYKKPDKMNKNIILVKNEKELIIKFLEIVKNTNTHFLISYNGDGFDLPYIKTRAKVLGISNILDKYLYFKPHKNINQSTTYIKGIQHIDVYRIMQHLSRIGAINLFNLKLDDVYFYFFKKHKIDISYAEMQSYYDDSKKLNKLIEYNLLDSKATFEIANLFLMQYIKLSQTVGKTIQEVIRSSSSSSVETKLMFETKNEDKIIPNIPKGDIISIRNDNRYQGGFVKSPEIGLHKDIAVLDFRSFHPSIIISFNISPETLNIENCKNEKISPLDDGFCQDKKATIPKMLEEILNKRIKLKQKMKDLNKNSSQYKQIYAEQWSLKILLNSTYGYLAYSRARWYCFKCARSILKYTHKYIHNVFEEAEKFNLKTIYSDTDSAFVLYKNKKDIFNFLDYINKKLPGVLYLSLDNIYKRGLFVSKKQDEKSAKKRYALIDEQNNLKITGFEYVRRDWSNIARNTQKQVLDILLKTGNVKDAEKVVIKIINRIKEGKIELKDLAIITKIKKPLDKYDSIGPHIAAAINAIKKGYIFNSGDYIKYIITTNGNSISEKARILELAKDYDKEYYINNQIIPAVKSIFEVFDYDESKLKSEPSQKKLF